MANFSMIVSQFLINSLIHRRRTSFEEVFMSVMKLSLLQVSLMFISLRILGESGGMFQSWDSSSWRSLPSSWPVDW